MTTAVMERPHVSEPKRSRQRQAGPRSETRQEYPRVAEALRELRRAANLSQEKFADKIGMSFSGYRPYERGDRDLTGAQIEAFAQALGVPVSEITRRIWPDDPAFEDAHYSHEWSEIQRQVESLPPLQREQILRIARQSIEIANGASDLARQN